MTKLIEIWNAFWGINPKGMFDGPMHPIGIGIKEQIDKYAAPVLEDIA